ncbi:hypothetical protein [Bradyrhizobium sp.]|jgi:hypothetical protein|uniref:hypothetical protein n=1 Tax=Bradyrhizobium sp. TaxID=376 RepID=UPI003BAF167B
MHAPFDRSNKSDITSPNRGTGFLVVPGLIVIALVTLAIIQPNMSRWISESVQAEFVGGGNMDDVPTQVARPDTATPERTVLAD